jgi:hypothetical protein
MRLVITVLLLGSFAGLNAQKRVGNNSIARTMACIPDSLTRSTNGIADYINSRFSTERDKSRAIFIWIARNIEYCLDSIFSYNYDDTPSEVSERILKTRTGVCMQYAYLFHEIASKTGINSYVIQGYTQQHGHVDFLPHVWCAVYNNAAWYLVDPTWGSGYVSNGKFVKQINNFYFMTQPKDMIRSHMPFDPLWQFLYFPVTNQEFFKRDYHIETNRPFFNYWDTLNTYEHESELERTISSARRIEQNGVKNAFIAAKLRVLQGKIGDYRYQTEAENYNNAVEVFNDGINVLNRFIVLRNNQFESDWDSLQLTQILDSAEYFFTTALEALQKMTDPEEGLASSMIRLNKAIRNMEAALNDQRSFLRGYLETWK